MENNIKKIAQGDEIFSGRLGAFDACHSAIHQCGGK